MTEEQEQQRELLGDNPITDPEFDWLNFGEYVNGLKEVLVWKETPFVLGVYGGWGTGKTSLMQLLKLAIENEGHLTVWFNPWKYDQKEEVWKALIRAVYFAIRTRSPLGTPSLEQMKKAAAAVGREFGNIIGRVLHAGDIGDEFSTLLSLSSYFENPFEQIFKDCLDELPEGNRLVVVFIDDLDRCRPEAVIEVLEALKLYLDVERCVFVIGVSDQVVADAVQHKYASSEKGKGPVIEGAHYLEKIVQLPFHIPPPDPARLDKFIKNVIDRVAPPEGVPLETWQEYIGQVGEATNNNPRQIKRFLSTVDLIDKIAPGEVRLEGQAEPVPFDRLKLAKVVLLQFIAKDFYDTLRRYTELLYHYQELARKRDGAPATDEEAQRRLVDEMMKGHLMTREEAEKVDTLTRDPRLRKVLVDEPHFDSEEEAQCYIQYSAGGRGPLQPLEFDATLADLFSDEDPVFRAAVRRVRGLGEEAVQSYSGALLRLLRSDDTHARWKAALTLGYIAAEQAVPDLIKALGDEEASVRWAAAAALRNIGLEGVVPDLTKVLADEDEEARVRQRAAFALGQIGAEEAVPDLIKALGDEDALVRWAAAVALTDMALMDIGVEEAVPELVKALGDERPAVRHAAALALEQIDTPEARKALEENRSK